MRKMKAKFERFKVARKVSFWETMLWSIESVIYIIGGFYAGFMLHATKSLIFFLMLFLILIIRFKWKTIEETTKKVRFK